MNDPSKPEAGLDAKHHAPKTSSEWGYAGGAREMPELLGLVGREISGPTRRLLETVEQLLDTGLSMAQREAGEKVRNSGRELLTVMNNILDLSRIEAGAIHLEAIDFDLHPTIAQVVALLRDAGHPRNLKMTNLIHHDVPALLRGDPGRLRQILATFLPYAFQFTGEEEVVLRIKVMNESEGQVTIRFEVTEADAELNKKMREGVPHTSEPESMERALMLQGKGLGFAICRRLAELMGGQFGVESNSPRGRMVWFSVCLEKGTRRAQTISPPRTDLRGLSALAVVDRQAAHKDMLAQTLSWGMTCDIALDGPQALEMLRAQSLRGQPYDLAILDFQIPGTDGLELVRAIRKDPSLSSVRPVILVAVGLRGDAEESRLAGIAGYLTKPVDQSELYHCLLAVMGVHGGAVNIEPQLVTSHSLKEARARRSPRILVAEDNTVNQKVAVRMLEKLGVQAEVAVNGYEAVAAFKRSHYDLILMDCQMPEVDGFSATRQIRVLEACQGNAHVPIVAVTASGMNEDREKCLAAGMDDYITKPLKLDQIRELLARRIPSLPSAEPQMESSVEAAQETAIDPHALEGLRIRDGDPIPDFFRGLVGQFLQEARSRLTAINQAVEHVDAGALKLAAHSLRGSSAVMGAKTMSSLCSELEDKAQLNNMNGASALAARLKNEFGRVREELEGQR